MGRRDGLADPKPGHRKNTKVIWSGASWIGWDWLTRFPWWNVVLMLSQFDVQVAGLIIKMTKCFYCRALMVIMSSCHGTQGCKQRGKEKPECYLLTFAWFTWFSKITYQYKNIHNFCFIIGNVNHYFTKYLFWFYNCDI